jgi:hypothetical protein
MQHRTKNPFSRPGIWRITENIDVIYEYTEKVPKGIIQPVIEKDNLKNPNIFYTFACNSAINQGKFFEAWYEANKRAGNKSVTIIVEP